MGFSKGDKVICINHYSNSFSSEEPLDLIRRGVDTGVNLPLTSGKVYEVIHTGNGYTHIINDIDDINFYISERFIRLSDYRESVIDTILS